MQCRREVRTATQDDVQASLRTRQFGIVGLRVARPAVLSRNHVGVRSCGLECVVLRKLIGERIRGACRSIVVDCPSAVPRYIAGAFGCYDAPALVGQPGRQRLSAIKRCDRLRRALRRDRVIDRRGQRGRLAPEAQCAAGIQLLSACEGADSLLLAERVVEAYAILEFRSRGGGRPLGVIAAVAQPLDDGRWSTDISRQSAGAAMTHTLHCIRHRHWRQETGSGKDQNLYQVWHLDKGGFD